MKTDRRWVASCAAFFLATVPVLADAPADTFHETTSVTVVEVPVEVTVGGSAVRGLTQDQFKLMVDGRPMAIDSFQEIDLGTEATPVLALEGGGLKQPPPAAGRRRILFLFDLSHNSVAAVTKAKSSAEQVLEKLAPTDLVGVATYSRAQGFTLLLHYSPDHNQVVRSLTALGNGQPIVAGDPLGIVVGPLAGETVDNPSSTRGSSDGRFGSLADEHYRDLQRLLEQAQVGLRASDAVSVYHQMEQLGDLCRTIDGRKHVVFFSAGLDDDMLAGTSDDKQRTNISRTANESGELWKVDSEEYFGSSRVVNSLDSLIDTLLRGECVLHTVDTSGVRAGGTVNGAPKAGASGLFSLADGTGGIYLENFNNFELALAEVLERTRISYLLTFVSPPGIRANGKFHKIKVEVDGVAGRPHLNHRPGFFAPDPKRTVNAAQKVMELGARLFDDRRPGELVVRGAAWPWVAADRKPLRHVPLVVEMDAPDGLVAPTPIDIMVYAFDADGTARDLVAQRFAYDPKAGAAGLKVMLPLLLPPGDFVLRILAREGSAGRTGVVVVPVAVPSEPRALVVPEELGGWQISRGNRSDQKPAGSHPFAFGLEVFSPALIARVTAPGSIPLVAVGLEGDEARLFDHRLQPVGKVVLDDERLGVGADGIARRALTAHLPVLPPGDYFLELDRVQVAFRVVAQPPTSKLIELGTSAP